MGKNTLKGKIKILSYFATFIFMVVVHMAMDKKATNSELNDGYAELENNNINTGDSLSDEEEEEKLKIIPLLKIKGFQLIQVDKFK
ncbi:MAG: hypothetical protein ACK5M3_06715 [Dysgonomonas sp.]